MRLINLSLTDLFQYVTILFHSEYLVVNPINGFKSMILRQFPALLLLLYRPISGVADISPKNFFAVLSPIAENIKVKFYQHLVILYTHNTIMNV